MVPRPAWRRIGGQRQERFSRPTRTQRVVRPSQRHADVAAQPQPVGRRRAAARSGRCGPTPGRRWCRRSRRRRPPAAARAAPRARERAACAARAPDCGSRATCSRPRRAATAATPRGRRAPSPQRRDLHLCRTALGVPESLRRRRARAAGDHAAGRHEQRRGRRASHGDVRAAVRRARLHAEQKARHGERPHEQVVDRDRQRPSKRDQQDELRPHAERQRQNQEVADDDERRLVQDVDRQRRLDQVRGRRPRRETRARRRAAPVRSTSRRPRSRRGPPRARDDAEHDEQQHERRRARDRERAPPLRGDGRLRARAPGEQEAREEVGRVVRDVRPVVVEILDARPDRPQHELDQRRAARAGA